MSSIGELQAEIERCRNEIEIIKQDINSMTEEKNNITAFSNRFNSNLTAVADYDLTVNNTWRKALCDDAIDKKHSIENGIGEAINNCASLNASLDTAISEAWRQISALEAQIAACEVEIQRLQEES